jgi:hypothetical protein
LAYCHLKEEVYVLNLKDKSVKAIKNHCCWGLHLDTGRKKVSFPMYALFKPHCIMAGEPDSSVGIKTSHGLDGWGLIPSRGKRYFSSPQCPDQL